MISNVDIAGRVGFVLVVLLALIGVVSITYLLLKEKRGEINEQRWKIEKQLQEVRKEMWDALLNGD